MFFLELEDPAGKYRVLFLVGGDLRVRGLHHPALFAGKAVIGMVDQLLQKRRLDLLSFPELVIGLVQGVDQMLVMPIDLLDPDQEIHIPLDDRHGCSCG